MATGCTAQHALAFCSSSVSTSPPPHLDMRRHVVQALIQVAIHAALRHDAVQRVLRSRQARPGQGGSWRLLCGRLHLPHRPCTLMVWQYNRCTLPCGAAQPWVHVWHVALVCVPAAAAAGAAVIIAQHRPPCMGMMVCMPVSSLLAAP